METTDGIKASSQRIWREIRCNLCEILFGWSIAIAPKDYVPSYVEAVVKAAKGGEDAVHEMAHPDR